MKTNEINYNPSKSITIRNHHRTPLHRKESWKCACVYKATKYLSPKTFISGGLKCWVSKRFMNEISSFLRQKIAFLLLYQMKHIRAPKTQKQVLKVSFTDSQISRFWPLKLEFLNNYLVMNNSLRE